ncbi:MAG: hypothetical protein WED33_12395 [Bacteroidia bacterium]
MLKFKLFLFITTISITASAWNTPTITSPSAGSDVYVGINLNWNSVSNSSFYQVQWDTSALFNSSLLSGATNAYINSSSGNSDTQVIPNI